LKEFLQTVCKRKKGSMLSMAVTEEKKEEVFTDVRPVSNETEISTFKWHTL
jgi:hypothetical protein